MKWRKWIALLLTLMLAAGMLPTALAAGAASPVCEHNWKRIELTATCTEPGIAVYECTKCGAYRDERVGPLGHDMGPRQLEVAPTCTDPGREIRVCKRNKNHVWSYEVEPLGHDWGEWEVVTQPTAEAEGLERRVCKRDESHVEERAIPKLDKEDEVPPLTEIKLTGSFDMPTYPVDHWAYAHYTVKNTGNVPVTLKSCEGDAVGAGLPTVLQPNEEFSWASPHQLTAQDYAEGFNINPEDGSKSETAYAVSNYVAFAAVTYSYDPGYGNDWESYCEAHPATTLINRVEGPSLTIAIYEVKGYKEEFLPEDIVYIGTTLFNNGSVPLDNLYITYSDDRDSFSEKVDTVDLGPGDYTTLVCWWYAAKVEDIDTTFNLQWSGHGKVVQDGTSGTGDGDGSVHSNTVVLPIKVVKPEYQLAMLTLSNADGSGEGKAVGDWVSSTMTFQNIGDVPLIIADMTINGPAGLKHEQIDYTAIKAIVAMSDKYYYEESDSFPLGFQVLEEDVQAGAVIRTVKLVGQNTDTGAAVLSNPVTVYIPLDEASVEAPADARLTLTGVCNTPDPLWFNFDGKTDPVSYTLTVINNGDVPVRLTQLQREAEGDPFVYDLSGMNIVLLPGDHTTLGDTYQFDESQADGDHLHMSYTVAGETEFGTLETTPVHFVHTVGEMPPWTPEAEIEIHKMETSSSLNLGGYVLDEIVTYDVTVTNNTDVEIEAVTVTDDHAVGQDQIITNLQPYESRTVSFSYTVQPEDVDNGYILNTAYASWHGTVPGTIDVAWDSCIVDVIDTPDREVYGIYLEKSVIETPALGYFTVDDVITFYLYVENPSTGELYDVVITDPMCDDITYPVLAPSQTDDIYFTHTLTLPEAIQGSLTNTATITGHDKDGNVYTWTDSVTVPTDYVPPGRVASLYLLKEVTNAPLETKGYQLDEKITYKITYINDGGLPLSNVTVYDAAPDGVRYLGTIPYLAPGESGSFPFEWTVLASDFSDDWVYNSAFAFYDTYDSFDVPVYSNTVKSPIWSPDPPPPPETPEGEPETCVNVLTGVGSDSVWYDLDLCGEHAETAAKTLELLKDAYGKEAVTAVWNTVADLWLEETHEMYDRLAQKVSGENRTAVYADRAALDHFVANMAARLTLLQPDDPVAVAKARAEWIMRQCAELCYLAGKAPEDRPDSRVFGRLTPPPSLLFAGESAGCGIDIVEDGTDKVQISERVCAAHAKDTGVIGTMLENSRNRKQYGDVFTRAQRLWRSHLNQITAAAYNAADEEARAAIIVDSQAFSGWIEKRAALLGVLYAGHPEAAAEVLCTLLREQVIVLCTEE